MTFCQMVMLDIIAAGVTVHHEISFVTGAQCEPAVICKVEDLLSGERQMHWAVRSSHAMSGCHAMSVCPAVQSETCTSRLLKGILWSSAFN